MQFKFTTDQIRREFSVRGGTGSAAVHVWRQVMDLFTILVGDDGPVRGSGIGSEDDSILVDAADNRRSGLCGTGWMYAGSTKRLITGIV
jgi:hypothetical protein